MINAATRRLSLVLFLIIPAARAQIPDQQSAIEEAIRRQADRLTLRDPLAQARAAQARHDLPTAATLYDACWDLIGKIGPVGTDYEIAKLAPAWSPFAWKWLAPSSTRADTKR